uniref:ESF1 nucleolar pre-rRNA processing protein homolog n=1 Tax=Anolis carolinensis TaxID=28377 RepID=A0A803TCZ8_ANOCA
MESKKEIINDQRFSCITKDPRFWEMPEKDHKIKIDKRFRAMFHDKKFKLKYTVDKRGRPINHSSTEDLKRFYALSDSDSDVSECDDKQTERKKCKSKGKKCSEKLIDAKYSKVAGCKRSPKSKTDALKNEGQKSKLKTTKNVKNFTAIESVQDKELKPKKQNKQGVMSAEDLHEHQKSSQKAVKKESVKECTTEAKEKDSSLSFAIEKDFKNQTCKNEENSDLEESEHSRETEEEGESEESGDLEEESYLGDDGEMTEERDSDDEEEETGEESGTDGDESDSGPDLARGKGNVETSSEEEEEDDMTELFPKEPEIIHRWGELTKDAPRADEITSRLAVCNMDWDRLKAKDLLALFNSFVPKGGVIFSVKIYPSEFGKARMKEEVASGPTELLSLSENVTEKDRFIPDDVTFDDEPKDVASEVDGAAYKPKFFTSAAVATSKVDITWDETDHERVTSLSRTFKKDELLDMDFQAYLASSSEEDDAEVDEGEHQQDVGVAQTAEKHKSHPKDDEEQIAKYRELLRGIQEKEKKHQETDMEMEIKWVPGLKESAEEMVRNKLEGKDKLTPWEQFLEKKKEKRKLKKKQKGGDEETLVEDEYPSDVDLNDPYFAEELKKTGLNKKLKKKGDSPEKDDTEKHKAEMSLLVMDEEEDERRHFNYDKIVEQQNLSKKKKKLLMKKKELLTDDFQVNVGDARFQAMYTSHLFNLDPSDPNFKKTKAVERILEEKARRRQQGLAKAVEREDITVEKESAASKSLDPALSMLIKSVKNKTEQFQARKKQKVK